MLSTLKDNFRAALPAVDFASLRFVEETSQFLSVRMNVAEPPIASVDRGVMLTGGGAMLGDLDLALREQTGLSITLADQPMSCVALGTGKALEFEKQLRHVIDYDS